VSVGQATVRRASGPIQKVVIVGGGSSGWMCAAALSRLTPGGVSVTLVESDEIGTIGVGEATIPSIMDFNGALGIKERDFVRETQATFKLGVEFADWGAIGERYMHPFGPFGHDTLAIKFHQFWLKASQGPGGGEFGELGDYSLAARAADLGRFARPDNGAEGVFSSLRYAYHFDAGLYARFLRRYSETRGVERTEGRVVRIEQWPEDGFIRAVILEDGRRIEGDLFIDCSGFRGLIIEDALKAGYESWTQWLFCDRAVAAPATNSGPPAPFTRASAEAAGWRWRIPLQHRSGNGYVYSSGDIDDAAACDRLVATAGELLAEPRALRFTPGRRKNAWLKNCVAVGLAAGFIEPLESTSIHLAQHGVSRLMALFPDMAFNAAEREEFNRLNAVEYEQTRDFIILHYKVTRRDDSPFWRRCRDMAIPDALAHKIDLFAAKGRVMRGVESLFLETSWIAVMLGQGIVPQGCDPLVDALPVDETRRYVRHVRDVIDRAARAMSPHQRAIDELIGAD
jgi:tryptophan halogenase